MGRHILLVAGCGLLLLAGFFLPARQPAVAQNAAGEILQLVNQVRAEHGLPPYAPDGRLAAAAQNHANWMVANGIYSHTGAAGSTPYDRAVANGYIGYVGENYVSGSQLTPQQGVTWWRNSPSHFNNMISPRYTQAGVGFVGGNQNLYVLVVGHPSDAPLPAAERETAVDVPSVVPLIQLSAPREDGSIVHKVLEGHSVWAIAARYGVSLADIYLFNGMNEDSVIQPGDELTIRLAEGVPPPPTPTPPATHRVREGESLWTIAANYKIDLATILWLNALPEDAVVHPGNEIVIRLLPGQIPPPTPTPLIAHIVRSGDTAWGIALRYGLTLEQLMAYNQMQPDALLQVGQALIVRPPTETPTPTPTSTPEATPTLTPEVATVQPLPAANRLGPTAVAVAAITPAPSTEDNPPGWSWMLGIGAMIAALGLTVLAVVAIFVMRRDAV
jgi:LysM repeat protein